jgi:hypothetical protein
MTASGSGDTGQGPRSSSAGPGIDRAAQATALEAFLRADPADRPRLAPLIVEQVGADRLRGIVDATLERVGGLERVTDSPDGLLVSGPTAAVLGWVRIDGDGALVDLLISPAVHGRRAVPAPVIRWGARIVFGLLLAAAVDACWGAADLLGWLGAALTVATGYLLYEGWSAPALETWWIRRPLEAGALVAVASTVRLPGLPTGDDPTGLLIGAGLLGLTGWALFRARRHRWGVSTPVPLPRFPLDGAWYVGQGGGRGLNHHLPVPEQRGALDLLRVGRNRSGQARSGSLESYPSYGAPVYAPCAGRVVSAVDGIEDQAPGTLRYGPLYGNHVFIDTGTETVKLAHLRPGTVAVTTGRTVPAGELLGEVGNSGNSSEPHLHIHAERDGQGLDLRFAGVDGHLHRGRTIRN